MEAMVVLRDLFEGLTRLDRECGADPGRRRELDGERRRPASTPSGCARTCKLVERRSAGAPKTSPRACAGWWIRPPRRSTRRSSTSFCNAPRHRRGQETGRHVSASPRPTTRRWSSRSAAPAPYLPGLMAHPVDARRCIARRSRSSATASRAPASRSRTARSCSPSGCRAATSARARNPHYWNNAANQHRRA